MRYVLLVYGEEAALKALSEEELRELDRQGAVTDEILGESGHLIVGHPLEWTSQATSLRTRGGRLVATDGPFAETKEQLLGFILIEAKDRDEALSLVAKLPMQEGYTIELRAVGTCGKMPS
ncbi:YciI family protein [Chelativorans salis]|uniref:YciI family protein n=1 Tax=Chelativorans salis TaxID=2978478 RepID=A0ABT2LJY1_9HYPH|nr:YciI family protein [Chelativorans sp. EGI FJ00035]MCT7374917.1 YciI family protein [Chelativorans sp. EGI FJ00035]